MILLACLLAVSTIAAVAAPLVETPRMRRFGPADGLPSRMVLALAQDHQGYLWAATSDGLARYDGLTFRVWRDDPGNKQAIPGNELETLVVDPQDRIWVGVNGSPLGMLDADRKGFVHFPEVRRICNGQIWSLGAAQGALWIGTSSGGLCRREENGRITAFFADPARADALPSNTIYNMITDARGHLWIGTEAGLVVREGDRFRRIAASRFHSTVFKLSKDPDGTLWVGSSDGLYRVTPAGVFELAPWRGAALLRAATVVHDRNGGYWVGAANGFYRVRPGSTELQVMEGDRGSGFLTAHSGVLDVIQDQQGGLWLGLISQGVAYLSPDWRRFSTLLETQGKPLESLYLVNAAADGEEFLVTTGEGLYRVRGDGQVIPVVSSQALGGDTLQSVLPAADGALWIAIRHQLIHYDPATGAQRRFAMGFREDNATRLELMVPGIGGEFWLSIVGGGVQHRAADGRILGTYRFGGDFSKHNDMVQQLLVRPDGSVWVASATGLWVWRGGRFAAIGEIGEGEVFCLAFASPTRFWLGRYGMLEEYVWNGARARLVRRLGFDQGVPAVETRGVVIARNAMVWATTARGLMVYTPGARQVRLFSQRDGLPDAEFSMRPPAVGPDGTVLALVATGIVMFDPALPLAPAPTARAVIESVQVRRDDAEHPQFLPLDMPLVLQAGDRDLRIAARLLSFVDPASTRYRYRIEGYDQNWVEQGASGERVVSRLPPGHYRIAVQARPPGGEWVPAPSLQLQVRPPWWLSVPALVAVAVLCLLLIWLGLWAWRRRVLRQQQWELAQQRQRLAEQASLAKTRFLATLGHEVRTPMTGVMGMSELLLKTGLDAKQRNYTESIRRAGTHLLSLVNDALDLARIESGRLELDLQPFSVRQLIADVEGLMAPLARSRNLHFSLEVGLIADLIVNGDVTRIRQILLNLLSNAIKFTERGVVALRLNTLGSCQGLRFEVADTGPGINAEQKARLFQRFEQGEGPKTTARYGGSGLGLAICQELAMAMDGNIEVISRLGAGTRFIVDLPLRWMSSHLLPDDTKVVAIVPPQRILLVEDDVTVAEVIVDLLRVQGHTVVHAPHGLMALTEAADNSFDLALLDLDLPGLDGFALARQLRAFGYDMPLVAVTARSDEAVEPHARQAGFDGFLRKPLTGDMLADAIGTVLRRSRAGEAGI